METVQRILGLIVIGTFTTSLVVAGHGVAPIGLIMIIGWEYWLTVSVMAWAAIAILVVGCLTSGRRAWGFMLAGAILVSLAWLAFLLQSDAILTTIIFSAHFLAGTLIFVYYLFKHRPV